MKRFWTWLRVVSPAEWVFKVAVGIGAFLAMGVIVAVAGANWAIVRSGPGMPVPWEVVRLVAALVPQFGAAAYGLLRAWYPNPLARESYLRWLRSTPWTPTRPLPLGPVTLCGQDAVWLGAFAVYAGLSGSPMAMVCAVSIGLLSFAAGSVAISLMRVGPYWSAYVAMFCGIGLAYQIVSGWIRGLALDQMRAEGRDAKVVLESIWETLPASVGLLAIIVFVVQIGLRQQLRRVPWDAASLRFSLGNASDRLQRMQRLGWPLAELNPHRKYSPRYQMIESVAIAVLAGWAAAIACALVELWVNELAQFSINPARSRGSANLFRGALLLWALMPPLLRHVGRMMRYQPPCNSWARIAARRLSLPGYDQINTSPVLCSLAALLGAGLVWSGFGGPGTMFLCVVVIVLLYFYWPPDEETFRLTGHYRLVKLRGTLPEVESTPPRAHFWD
ncbi:MAG: hypothetical protein U0836_09680 [Pirellulales bacterium]